MNKTKIEYADYSWNPLSGCTKGCSYCYARRLARGRLRKIYLANPNVAPDCDPSDPFSPRIWRERLSDPLYTPRPSKIFTVDMGDLWDPHIPPDWIKSVLTMAELASWHIFQFLTKRPHLARQYDFPSNSWVGITITNDSQEARIDLAHSYWLRARVKFLSIEPLLGPIHDLPTWIDWVIIGAMTGPKAVKPKKEWVQDLIRQAERNGTPVFLKDNLNWAERRTEWPKGITT